MGVGEPAEPRLEQRVVEPRPAVEQQQHRLLAHDRTVGLEARALDVEVQTEARLDLDPHAASTMCIVMRRGAFVSKNPAKMTVMPTTSDTAKPSISLSTELRMPPAPSTIVPTAMRTLASASRRVDRRRASRTALHTAPPTMTTA